MRLAIFGATSQIAKDLMLSMSAHGCHDLTLFARRPEVVTQWLASMNFPGRYTVADFTTFGADASFDAVINFVGVGDPARAVAMGAAIFDVTLKYDEMALAHVLRHPDCRYLFLSSGAAYGSAFEKPVDESACATIPINSLQPQDWYGAAKLHAECRHRALAHLSITDIRIFNYFSRTQDMAARFFVTDIMRAIQGRYPLSVTPANIVRDYLHPADFHQLVERILGASPSNQALDAYSKAPIDKFALLNEMKNRFALQFTIDGAEFPGATGQKPNYYSLDRRAGRLGYLPTRTSLDCIHEEVQAILC